MSLMPVLVIQAPEQPPVLVIEVSTASLAIGDPSASDVPLSPAAQQLLEVADVDDALRALARPLPAAVEQEVLALIGGEVATLADILTLLLRRSGALSPGGGDYNPAL